MSGVRMWLFLAGAVLTLSTVWLWNGFTLLGMAVVFVTGALEFWRRVRD